MTSIELGWGSLSEEGARALSGRLDGEVSNPIMPVLMTPRCQQLWTLVVGSRCSSSPRLRVVDPGKPAPEMASDSPGRPQIQPRSSSLRSARGVKSPDQGG